MTNGLLLFHGYWSCVLFSPCVYVPVPALLDWASRSDMFWVHFAFYTGVLCSGHLHHKPSVGPSDEAILAERRGHQFLRDPFPVKPCSPVFGPLMTFVSHRGFRCQLKLKGTITLIDRECYIRIEPPAPHPSPSIVPLYQG